MFTCEHCKREMLVRSRNIVSAPGKIPSVEKIEALCDWEKCPRYLVSKFFLWDGTSLVLEN